MKRLLFIFFSLIAITAMARDLKVKVSTESVTDSAATAVKIKVEESKLKCDMAELGRLCLDYFKDAESVPQSIAEQIDEIDAQKAIIKKLKELKTE